MDIAGPYCVTTEYCCYGFSTGKGGPNPFVYTRKWKNDYYYVHKTSGVTYYHYVSDDGAYAFWASSDGSTPPTTFDENYRPYIDMSGDFKDYSALGLGGSGPQIVGVDAGLGQYSITSLDPTGTSPGRGTGGDSGSSDTSGSNADWSKLLDYSQGIQRNTKAIADNLVEVERDLETLKSVTAMGGAPVFPGGADLTVNQTVGTVKTSVDAVKGSVDGVGTGVGQVKTSVDATKSSVDAVKTSTDAVKTAVDAVKGAVDTGNSHLSTISGNITSMKNDMVTVGDPETLQDPNIGAYETESYLGEGAVAGYESDASSAFSTVLNTVLQENPLVALVQDFSFEASGSCVCNLDFGKFGQKPIDASKYSTFLQSLGLVLLGLANVRGFLLLLEG